MSRFREAHFDIDDSPPSDDDPRQSTKELAKCIVTSRPSFDICNVWTSGETNALSTTNVTITAEDYWRQLRRLRRNSRKRPGKHHKLIVAA